MLPIDRQKQILTWLKKEQTLKVADLSKRLDVSEMTIYRDIKPLIDDQKVQKTSNGITFVQQTNQISNLCVYCYKSSLHTRLSVQLIKTDLQVEETCCIHCGLLRYQNIQSDVSQILCRDFLNDSTISARTATFLIHADINLNCCQPQVIALNSLNDANRLRIGFGGEICDFEEAIVTLIRDMQINNCCQQKQED